MGGEPLPVCDARVPASVRFFIHSASLRYANALLSTRVARVGREKAPVWNGKDKMESRDSDMGEVGAGARGGALSRIPQ